MLWYQALKFLFLQQIGVRVLLIILMGVVATYQ